MKDIPFYPNREDYPDSCMLAAIRSGLEYLSGQKYTWQDMEELLGYQPGKAAWTVKVWTDLARRGFDVRMIEPFDYPRYSRDGLKYLQSIFGKDKLDYEIQHTNLLEIQPLLPEFLKSVHQVMRPPTLKDIDRLLAEGYIVFVVLNSRILNNKPGYVGHMILVYDKDEGSYIAHDPGFPAFRERRIPGAKLKAAMKDHEVTGVKR